MERRFFVYDWIDLSNLGFRQGMVGASCFAVDHQRSFLFFDTKKRIVFLPKDSESKFYPSAEQQGTEISSPTGKWFSFSASASHPPPPAEYKDEPSFRQLLNSQCGKKGNADFTDRRHCSIYECPGMVMNCFYTDEEEASSCSKLLTRGRIQPAVFHRPWVADVPWDYPEIQRKDLEGFISCSVLSQSPAQSFCVQRGLKGPSWIVVRSQTRARQTTLHIGEYDALPSSIRPPGMSELDEVIPAFRVWFVHFEMKQGELLGITVLQCLWQFGEKLELKSTVLEFLKVQCDCLFEFRQAILSIEGPDLILAERILTPAFQFQFAQILRSVPTLSALIGDAHSCSDVLKMSNASLCDAYFRNRTLMDLNTLAESFSPKLREQPFVKTIDRLVADFVSDFSLKRVFAKEEASPKDALKAWTILAQEHRYLESVMQLARNSGCPLRTAARMDGSRTLEWLLCHEFWSKGYLPPPPERCKSLLESEALQSKNVPEQHYEGGKVLEAKAGLWSDVFLLDVQSSYPSSMSKMNVCFSTLNYFAVEKGTYDTLEVEKQRISNPDVYLHPEGERRGIIAQIEEDLLKRRSGVKAKLSQLKSRSEGSRSPDADREIIKLSVAELVLKLQANTMYGILGMQGGLFYCRPLAEFVTRTGRFVLERGLEIAKNPSIQWPFPVKPQFECIYGDTDSLMLKIHFKEPLPLNLDNLEENNKMTVMSRCMNILADHINAESPGIRMKPDGTFSHIILFKKKHYIGLGCDNRGQMEQLVFKGVEIVQSVCCRAAARFLRSITGLLFSYSEHWNLSSFNTNAQGTKRRKIEAQYCWRTQLKAEVRERLIELGKKLGRYKHNYFPEDFFVSNKHKWNHGKDSSSLDEQATHVLPQTIASRISEALDSEIHSSIVYAFVKHGGPVDTLNYDVDKHTHARFAEGIPLFPKVMPASVVRAQWNRIVLDIDHYVEKQFAPYLFRLLMPFGLYSSAEKISTLIMSGYCQVKMNS